MAQSIDIENARFDGYISGTNTTGFTYTRNFNTASDDYVVTLDYISSSTANGNDSSGNPITGFKYWNFTFPTILTERLGGGEQLHQCHQRRCQFWRDRGHSGRSG